ncbi:MAG: hypothetical protein DMG64_16490 [Acidobacteria bacterium]|nr:MAG: hypothetical protein DMG63_10265 [Acidobacteriota bacterium]PYY00634.1 MAG: hypothetical protein DMG64_16490 [Acidobacteriota bacterium]PYY22701.1 MAG: hypothetical protein DMG62_11850 [Acidobacteriota bacterium]
MKLPQIWLTIVLTVFSFSSSVPAFSQQEPAFPGVQSRVLVSVEPRHGKQVPAVRKEDVTITQGKQRDKVLAWQSVLSPEVGAQVFVLIDDSLSSSEMGSKLNDIRDFISAQPVSVLVGIAYMRNGTALVAQNPTSEHALAAKALRLSIGDGGSSPSPYFALQDLLKRWPQSNSAREVIMITDGIDRFWDGVGLDDPYLNSAIEEAQRGGVVVNALYARGGGHFGHSPWMINWGQNYLSEMADATGGEAYYVGNDTPPSFRPYFTDLTERISHQFLLTFEAQPGKKSGFERIKLSTEVPNVELVTQRQVYVPIGS